MSEQQHEKSSTGAHNYYVTYSLYTVPLHSILGLPQMPNPTLTPADNMPAQQQSHQTTSLKASGLQIFPFIVLHPCI